MVLSQLNWTELKLKYRYLKLPLSAIKKDINTYESCCFFCINRGFGFFEFSSRLL